jgi:hypothetical protein
MRYFLRNSQRNIVASMLLGWRLAFCPAAVRAVIGAR